MKTLTAVLLLSAMAAQGQIIQCTPVDYSISTLVQNNIGRVWDAWEASARDEITLGTRVLTFRHSALFDSTVGGTRRGPGPRLVDTYKFRQIGAAAYVPIGGEQVTMFAPMANGNGWIASTNYVPASDMEPIVYWLPGFVGTTTIGDRYRQVVTTATPLTMFCRNIGSGAYLLRIPCWTGTTGTLGFNFAWRFEKGEKKLVTLSVNQVQRIFVDNGGGHWAGCHYFGFSLDNLPEEQQLNP